MPTKKTGKKKSPNIRISAFAQSSEGANARGNGSDGADSDANGDEFIDLGTSSNTGANTDTGRGKRRSNANARSNGGTSDETGNVHSGNRGETSENGSRPATDGERTGGGDGSGSRSNPGYTGSVDGAETTTEGERSARSSIPRQVSFGSLGGAAKSGKSHALTVEFVSEAWTLAFRGLAFLFQDKEWEIDQDADGAELGERSIAFFESLDKKRSAEWEKRIAKWQPFLALVFAVIAIVLPRILHMRELREKRIQAAKKPATDSGKSERPAATTETAPSIQEIRAASNPKPPVNGNGNSPGSDTRYRPVNPARWTGILGEDD